MPAWTKTLSFRSEQPIEFQEITESVQTLVQAQRAQSGLLHIASCHTTAAVMINERCEKLQEDMLEFLRHFVPAEHFYQHNTVAGDGRPNAHSHLLSMFLPSTVTLSIMAGKLQLGTWQSLFFVELDGPRAKRQVRLSFLGE